MNNSEVKTLYAGCKNPVAVRAEVSLKMVYYMAHHYQRTSRFMVPGELRFDNVGIFTNHQKAEVDYKVPINKLKPVKVEKILDLIEEFLEQLALFDGIGGRPLLFKIWQEVVPPKPETDIPFGEAYSAFASLRDKIQARATHATHA
jgi:hypothetical protein